MSEEKMWVEFEVFWNAPEQDELRMSCAKGWAFEVWRASRAALVVDLPKQYDIGGMASDAQRHPEKAWVV